MTEFLPVSSSAHLKLTPWLFGWEAPPNEMAFDVALHFGTLFAVGFYFFFDWLMIFAYYIGDARQGRWLGGANGSMLPKLVLGTIPGAIIGKLFEKPIERAFYKSEDYIWILAVTLAVFGLLLFIAERVGKQKRQMNELSYRDALIIGTAQALAVVPGVSRSGVTILAGLLLSLTRPAAARFSFLLAAPIIAGASLVEFAKLVRTQSSFWTDWSLLIGIAASAISGFIAIHWMLGYVQKRRYDIFVYYRWLLACIVLAAFFMRQPKPDTYTPEAVRQAKEVTSQTQSR